jgi:hypothetical protein
MPRNAARRWAVPEGGRHGRELGLVKFVGDMGKAVAFHRDVLGLGLRFESPFWSEFDTGPTTLALHPASPKNPPAHASLASASPT